MKTSELYPENLLNAIMAQDTSMWFDKLFEADGSYQFSFDTNKPSDLYGSLEYILYTLTDRERQVIEMRYKYVRTLKDISKEYELTTERIRQIETKALRKLRHPTRLNYIKYGVQGMMKLQVQNAEALGYNKGFSDSSESKKVEEKDNIKSLSDLIILDDKDSNEDAFKSFPIEYLDLSVRSFNCLKRAGIKSLFDLSKLTYEDLVRVRNMGVKSAEEVILKASNYGIEFRKVN